MSLHIGRLTPDVRHGYLEHLFQRFGDCTVKLKDGYGFAVYDSNDDAARAMRALQGKYVCGGRITVNWSKQQPRLPKDFRRRSRIVESSRRRTSRDDNFRDRDSVAQKNQPANHDNSHKPYVAPEKKSDEIIESSKDAEENIDENPVEMKRDEGGTSDANAIEHGRWGETGKGNPDEDGDDFDHYEPYHGYVRQEEAGKVIRESSYDNCDHRRSSDKLRNELSFREKQELRLRRFQSPSKQRPEYNVNSVAQTHCTVQDGRQPFPDRAEDRRHIPRSENVPQAPKERKRSRSKRFRESSLSSDRTTPSRSRSRSPSRAHSPSCSAHSSSKSSQPMQPEGVRLISNVSYPRSLLVSVSPQHNSPSAAENKKIDVVMNSSLEGKVDLKTRPGIKQFDDYTGVKYSRMNREAPVTSSKLATLSNGESLVSCQDAAVPGCAETNMDENMIDDVDVAKGVQSQNTNCKNISSVESNKDSLVKNGRTKSLKLTTNEVVSALKHNAMETHDTDLLNQPVGKYFGAARLWPWEIIYYRRLKKGPISTQNYAKRLEQNKEYGIVDQYVRSSSGWWEC